MFRRTPPSPLRPAAGLERGRRDKRERGGRCSDGVRAQAGLEFRVETLGLRIDG
jgi:hypothetical protein